MNTPSTPSVEPADLIAGALYDLMGYLTTRDETIRLGSTELATPAADALVAFAKKRGLSLDNPAIKDWSASIAAPLMANGLTEPAGPPGSPVDPEICNERSTQACGPVYCGDSGGYCDKCPKRRAQPAPQAAPTVPEGYQLVPVEPTQEMLAAMQSSGWLPGCYRAMLAAAPQEPQR